MFFLVAPDDQQLSSTPETDSRSIYIGNVDYQVTAQALGEFFTQCGAVVRVTIPTTVKGKPKGYAYLEFADRESVARALQLNGTTLNNRPIKV